MSDDSLVNRLSAETRAKLRSTQFLTSLPHIVSELLQNSIDSGASHIDVGVDCEDWSCWVRDDGSGFAKDGLAQIAKGSEDGRYMSSKAYSAASLESVSTFGFRGEALASMADLCCLEISSRTARSRESWSIIMKGGQTLYTGPSVRWRRESAGTAVSVRDAFFNRPIRRLSHPSSSKTLEIIRQEIESYALVFPGISFSLENTGKSNKGGGNLLSCVLKIPKTRSTLTTFRHIYGRAFTQHVEEIDSVSGDVRIEGFVSLVGVYTKAYQFLYINKHPVSYCDLHKLIDLRFSSSSFPKHAYDEEGETSSRSGGRRPPRKGEKKPIYVLNLAIPARHIDNCVEPAKTAVQLGNKNTVAYLLSSVIQSFLARHHFAPGYVDENEGTPRKKRKLSRQASLTEPNISRPSTPDSCMQAMEPSDGTIWTDPSTGETFIIDLGTGNSYPQNVPCGVSANGPVRIRSMGNTIRDSPSMIEDMTTGQGDVISAKDEAPNWLQEALQEDLQAMRVISQVDRKFVVCLIGADNWPPTEAGEELGEGSTRHGGGKTLVLVDQHAADERVRVERFLREICNGFLSYHDKSGGVETIQLSPPVPVLLTHREASRLSEVLAYQKAFASWGVLFHGLQELTKNEAAIDSGEHAAYIQVFVTAIPKVVSEKLLSGNELQELIKGYLGTLENELGSFDIPAPPRSGVCETETRWVKALRWCPRVLLDLINSKACRGAIMFNDSLTLEQCQRLIKQLSATAFPFQCAHGRCVSVH
ncbi:hypothetical protein M404DRAFT_12760 [Pisolithus tinctorius Marx 270]|uniref:MutL C-terminal dimerisation domain-containing protein n=1 Tax=Pisolithus tinctorius Marx 270 TaxID=870435 RepID=A0A0C3KSR2_PISTI|nr:hypothetical protein M404DRAFT_12760 [Pisolithus tinctorius Marx 270]